MHEGISCINIWYMGLENIYDPSLKPIYFEATDLYLSSIPVVKTFHIPEDLARSSSSIGSYVRQALEANRDALRDIETSRRAIAFRASVLKKFFEEFGELTETLSSEVKQEVEEWSDRIVSSEGNTPDQ